MDNRQLLGTVLGIYKSIESSYNCMSIIPENVALNTDIDLVQFIQHDNEDVFLNMMINRFTIIIGLLETEITACDNITEKDSKLIFDVIELNSTMRYKKVYNDGNIRISTDNTIIDIIDSCDVSCSDTTNINESVLSILIGSMKLMLSEMRLCNDVNKSYGMLKISIPYILRLFA